MKENFLIKYEYSHIESSCFFCNDMQALEAQLVSKCNPCLFVTDTTVAALPPVQKLMSALRSHGVSVLLLQNTIHYKNIESVLFIVQAAKEAGLMRNSTFIACGGGGICDLTSFAASIYMRGAKLTLIPTTLLAMADAAIGGKTACDFDEARNFLGTFYPAEHVYLFGGFIQYQTKSEYFSGLAEVFKTALLFDSDLFALFKNESSKICEPSQNQHLIDELITRSVKAKAHIVQNDLTERGMRSLLNLGHTFAHALESIGEFGKLTHGEAVAWGIGRSLDLSVNLKLCAPSYRDEIFCVLKKYGWNTNPLFFNTDNTQAEQILKAMQHDKKNNNKDTIRCILQRGLCDTIMYEAQKSDILAVLK